MSEYDEPTSRCCINCRYSGYFIGYDGLTCELTGKPRKRPNNYTNCKLFRFDDPIRVRTIACGEGLVVSA